MARLVASIILLVAALTSAAGAEGRRAGRMTQPKTPTTTYRHARKLVRQQGLPGPILEQVLAGMREVHRGATAKGSSIEYNDKHPSFAFLEANGANDAWHELAVAVGDREDGHVILGDYKKAIHWRFTPSGRGERILLVDVNRGERTWYRLRGGTILEQSSSELRP